MDMLGAIKGRRSVRKFDDRQVPDDDLDKIIEAGLHSANAGGAERSMIVALHDRDLAARVGKMNMARFDRGNLKGTYVSADQPSVIDDPSIKNGFYGAPAAVCVFCERDFAFAVADAFAMVQTMALEAYSLGVSSCIVSRAEQTFASAEGEALLAQWGVPDTYLCRAFLALGYCDGPYPQPRPRRAGRVRMIRG